MTCPLHLDPRDEGLAGSVANNFLLADAGLFKIYKVILRLRPQLCSPAASSNAVLRLSTVACDGASIAAGLDHSISACPARCTPADDDGFSFADIRCVSNGFFSAAVVGYTCFAAGSAGGTSFFVVVLGGTGFVVVFGGRSQDAHRLLRPCRQA